MNRLERRIRTKAIRSVISEGNKLQDEALRLVQKESWPVNIPSGLLEVWRSRNYLLQVYTSEFPGVIRLSICRAAVDFDAGSWADKIPWEDLQRLKRECGRGDFDAVEIYPNDKDVVHVANMRHLWVLSDNVSFAWRK